MEQLKLTTTDGATIAADYYPADGDRFAILLHMMPSTKESWANFAAALAKQGIASIAIDERGHGASTGGPNGYKHFTDEDQQQKILDVNAAWEELKQRGATLEKTAVVGASIGANLVFQFMAENNTVPIGVSLSPGLDYRGVLTTEFGTQLDPQQKILMVASEEDAYSYQSVLKLDEGSEQLSSIQVRNLGHGTTMFENDPELMKRVVDWINKYL